MKTRPSPTKTIKATQNQTAETTWHLYRSTHSGMKASIMHLKTPIAHIFWSEVSVWMPVRVKPINVCAIILLTGPAVIGVIFLLQVPMQAGQRLTSLTSLCCTSRTKVPSPPRQTFPVGKPNALQHICTVQLHIYDSIFTQGTQAGCINLREETHMPIPFNHCIVR